LFDSDGAPVSRIRRSGSHARGFEVVVRKSLVGAGEPVTREIDAARHPDPVAELLERFEDAFHRGEARGPPQILK
jgi:hypothetical protein